MKIQGVWCCLYRASDSDGNLVDSMLSSHRDMEAAKRCFARSRKVAGHGSEKVTTDGHDASPRAIRETLGERVVHRCSPYMNNRIDQDHRGIKGRYRSLRGFGSFAAAARFCTAHDELRDYLRVRTRMKETASLAEQRHRFEEQWAEVWALLQAA